MNARSPAFRLTFARAAASAALALAAASHAPSAEPATSDDRQLQIVERIRDVVSREGPHASELIEPLTRLALLYREDGDSELAAAALLQAMQAVRVNRGLHSLDQAPLMRQLIELHEELDELEAARDLELELLTLVRRYPDDLRTVPILREIADRQMGVVERFLAGSTPPQVFLGCYYKTWPQSESGSCYSGSRKDAVRGMLAEAQSRYAEAIAVLLRNELYSTRELRELELALLRGSDLVRSHYDLDERFMLSPGYAGARHVEPWRSRTAPIAELAGWDLPYPAARYLDEDAARDREIRLAHVGSPYHRGRQSLRRLYAYEVASSQPLSSRADAIIEMADWDLLYSQHAAAMQGYELVHRMLDEAGASRATVERLFAPEVPVVLPTFLPNPLASDPARATGYIDVAFTITRFGRGRNVQIVATRNATEAATEHVVRLIKSSRFRPRLTDGVFARKAPVVMRYYASE